MHRGVVTNHQTKHNQKKMKTLLNNITLLLKTLSNSSDIDYHEHFFVLEKLNNYCSELRSIWNDESDKNFKKLQSIHQISEIMQFVYNYGYIYEKISFELAKKQRKTTTKVYFFKDLIQHVNNLISIVLMQETIKVQFVQETKKVMDSSCFSLSKFFDMWVISNIVTKWMSEETKSFISDNNQKTFLSQLAIMIHMWGNTKMDSKRLASTFALLQRNHSNDSKMLPILHFAAKCLSLLDVDYQLIDWIKIDTELSLLKLDSPYFTKLQNLQTIINPLEFDPKIRPLLDTFSNVDENLLTLVNQLSQYDLDTIKSTKNMISSLQHSSLNEYFISFPQMRSLMISNFFSYLRKNNFSDFIGRLKFEQIELIDLSYFRNTLFIRTPLSESSFAPIMTKTICDYINQIPEREKIPNFNINDVKIEYTKAKELKENVPTHEFEFSVFTQRKKRKTDDDLCKFINSLSQNINKFQTDAFPHLKIIHVDTKTNKVQLALKQPSTQFFVNHEIECALWHLVNNTQGRTLSSYLHDKNDQNTIVSACREINVLTENNENKLI